MSAEFFRRVPIEELAQRGARMERRELNRYLWNRIQPTNGLNAEERAEARCRVLERIAEIHAAAAAENPTPRQTKYPAIEEPPPFSRAELLCAVREIREEVRYYRTSKGDAIPYGWEPSEAVAWLLRQVRVPSCLQSTACPPGGAVCAVCKWIFVLHSTAGRETLNGTMLELEHRLGLLYLLGGSDER